MHFSYWFCVVWYKSQSQSIANLIYFYFPKWLQQPFCKKGGAAQLRNFTDKIHFTIDKEKIKQSSPKKMVSVKDRWKCQHDPSPFVFRVPKMYNLHIGGSKRTEKTCTVELVYNTHIKYPFLCTHCSLREVSKTWNVFNLYLKVVWLQDGTIEGRSLFVLAFSDLYHAWVVGTWHLFFLPCGSGHFVVCNLRVAAALHAFFSVQEH